MITTIKKQISKVNKMTTERHNDGSKTEYCGNERITYDGKGNITERYVARTSEEKERLSSQAGFVAGAAYAAWEQAVKSGADLETRAKLASDANVWDEAVKGPPGLI